MALLAQMAGAVALSRSVTDRAASNLLLENVARGAEATLRAT